MAEVVATSTRKPISGFRFGKHALRTYFDSASNAWAFEEWEDNRLVTKRVFRTNPDEAENLFSKAAARITTNHNVRKMPLISRYDLPEGVKGVRTFDPAKRRKRLIFDDYPNHYATGKYAEGRDD